MQRTSQLLGLLLTFGVLLLAAASGPGSLVHAPLVLFILAITIGGLLMNCGAGATCAAFRAALLRQDSGDQDSQARHDSVLSRAVQLAWAGGGIAALLGTTQMLQNLSDPNAVAVGVANCMLGLLYGACLAELVLRSLRHRLQHASLA